MNLNYTKKLDFKLQKTSIKTQNIDDFALITF